MMKRFVQITLYLAGPLIVLIVVAFAVSPGLFAPAGIPVTAPSDPALANAVGLAASLAGALVLGGSIWWLSRRGGG